MIDKVKNNYEVAITIFLFLILTWLGITVDTTGDSGDSVLHFLYSKHSFSHPELFLNHWAKPLFVLLSSPFSQFGFKGIILFNCLVVCLTGLFTFWTARNLNLKYPWLIFIIIIFCPLFFKLIFSGLTEYLFGLFLIIPIYLITKNKYFPAAIIVSFSPFIRSEGLIILGVFFLFLLIIKKYKTIPFLLTGNIFYSFVGLFHYKDPFWVFTKIPYANLNSPYGTGEILDFVHRLNYVIEKPIYFLLFIGFVSILYHFIRQRSFSYEILLICSIFLSIFVAHSLFWWLGIFNSMGLPRVLISLVPEIAIIALIGFEFIAGKVRPSIIKYTIMVAVALIVVFPFTYRAQGVIFNKDLFKLPDNELIEKEVVPYLKQNYPGLQEQLIFYSYPYISVALNIDHFNPSRHMEMNTLSNLVIPPRAIIIWDDWYSVVEGGVSLERLMQDKNLQLVREFKKQDNERTIKFVIFVPIADNPVGEAHIGN